MSETDVLRQLHQLNNADPATDYSVREVSKGGRTYTVVPVVMMVEGVHAGSAGPILHLPQYFSQDVAQWNGVPATAGHPENDGRYVLVNDADNPREWIVGYVDNAHVDDGKLKAEVWIDQQLALAVNPEVLNYVTEGKALDVSTGLLSVDRQEQGQHNGEEYHAITVEYRADHLAILPGQSGACSWSDGCGIRTNQQTEANNEMSKLTKQQINERKSDLKEGKGVSNNLQANEMGFRELSRMIQGMLDRRDSDARYHYLKEVWDDTFVYAVHDRDQGWEKYYRQEYTVDEQANDVSLEGDAVQVRKNVEYVPIQTNTEEDIAANQEEEDCGCNGKMKRTKFNNNKNKTETIMSDKDKSPSMEVTEKVVSLVNNERTRFTKTDKEWLLTLNESQLEKLEPTEAPEKEVTREQALAALKGELEDPEKFKNLLPDNVQANFEVGMKAYDAKRQKLIKHVQANTNDGTWPEDDLKAMELTTLERLAKSVTPTDYSGLGAGGDEELIVNSEEDDSEMLYPAGVNVNGKS